MPEKDTENINSDLVTEDNDSSVIGSRKEKLNNSNKNNTFIGGEIVSKEKLKKGFTATQKTIAFIGSILSLIVASFTVNNLIRGTKATNTDNKTVNSTSIVKVIEKEKVPHQEKSGSLESSKHNNSETSSIHSNINSENNKGEDKSTNNISSEEQKNTSSNREKEIVRENNKEDSTSVNKAENSESSTVETSLNKEENSIQNSSETKSSSIGSGDNK